MAKERTEEEKEAIRLLLWWAKQPLQEFEVVDGNGERFLIKAHEPQIDKPQPILTLVQYVVREREELVVSGPRKDREEKWEAMDMPIILNVANFNAGAWISCRDIAQSDVIKPVNEANDGE